MNPIDLVGFVQTLQIELWCCEIFGLLALLRAGKNFCVTEQIYIHDMVKMQMTQYDLVYVLRR